MADQLTIKDMKIPVANPDFAALRREGRWTKRANQPAGTFSSFLDKDNRPFGVVAWPFARNEVRKYQEAERIYQGFCKGHGLEIRKAMFRATSRKSLRRCPRYFMFSERLGLTLPQYRNAMDIGITWHALLAHLYRGVPVENLGRVATQRVNEIRTTLEPTMSEVGLLPNGKTLLEQMDVVERDMKMALAMAVIFADRYPPERLLETYDIVSIEQPYAVRVPGLKAPLGIKPDLVLRNKTTGEYWIADHKSVGGSPRQRAAVVSYEFQPRFYAWVLWLALNVDRPAEDPLRIGGWFFNIMQRPSIRYSPTKLDKDGFDHYVERVVEWYREQTLLRADDPPFYQTICPAPNVLLDEELLMQVQEGSVACNAPLNIGRFYRDDSQCFGQFGNAPCSYMALCTSDPAEWPDILKSHYVQAFRDLFASEDEGVTQ